MSVPSAPEFRPTYEEWKDFAAYVRHITPQIARYGACLIHPPAEWKHEPVPKYSTPRQAQITPLKQHVVGREGKYQAMMEQCNPIPLDQFIRDSVATSNAVEGSSVEELDAKFWRQAASPSSAMYGADTSEAGSLFEPTLTEWNLSALPGGVDHDLTQSLPMALPGLNRSMLYFGRWRSFFAMHTEDSELQGASYLHWGAPKRWYVVPPTHDERVRVLAASVFPELADDCASFLRHKTTLLSPQVLKASNIPCHSVLQTEGTFVVVLSSAFHFGYNLGANCAEAVNFGLTSWLPRARTAQPCTCDGHQTPHIEVPFLMRCVRQAHPEVCEASDEWWCFCCKCGEVKTHFDGPDEAPEGEQFECSRCGQWGHVECYAEYAAAAAAGGLPEQLYCVSCTDSWCGGENSAEAWFFSCVCGQHEGASHLTVLAGGDAPTGRMFQCAACEVWSHTECDSRYRDVDDDELPDDMRCHKCSRSVTDAVTPTKAHKTQKRAPAPPPSPAKKRASMDPDTLAERKKAAALARAANMGEGDLGCAKCRYGKSGCGKCRAQLAAKAAAAAGDNSASASPEPAAKRALLTEECSPSGDVAESSKGRVRKPSTKAIAATSLTH